MSYSLPLQQLIEAVKRLSLDDDLFLAPTDKQLGMMNGQIMTALKPVIDEFPGHVNAKDKRHMRIRVLRTLTGLPITTSKQLTRKSCSIIIDQLLEGRSDELVRELERSIEA